MNRRDFLTLLALVIPGTALPAPRVPAARPLRPSPDAPPPARPVALGGSTPAPSPVPAVVHYCGLGTNARGRLRYVLTSTGRVQAQLLSSHPL